MIDFKFASSMLELFQAPQNLPFVLALGLVVLLAVGQVLMLLVGGMVSVGGSGVDADFDVDAEIAPWSAALDWLGVGKLPFSILFSLWAMGFGLGGLMIQAIAKTQTGAFLPALMASGIAFLVSLPLVKIGGLILKPLIPRDETEAVSLETLVGREGEIVVGTARRGRPTQARVSDQWGTIHYVLVEPENDDESFAAGSKVLLLKRENPIFRVISGSGAALE
ncbi:MAG TPA: OB-fold-containig protein [Abditibacterium sp.]|jgi:hypothetical protein